MYTLITYEVTLKATITYVFNKFLTSFFRMSNGMKCSDDSNYYYNQFTSRFGILVSFFL
jgi:hypothetical protein